jgi:putative flippase GtrA
LFLSFSLHPLGSPTVFAQALAIVLVTAFNFAFHHVFTYRGASHREKGEGRSDGASRSLTLAWDRFSAIPLFFLFFHSCLITDWKRATPCVVSVTWTTQGCETLVMCSGYA